MNPSGSGHEPQFGSTSLADFILNLNLRSKQMNLIRKLRLTKRRNDLH
jgi:hypothetical protein